MGSEANLASIGVSEFTFGFAYLSAAVRAAGDDLLGFPVLPAGQDEAYLGWDAEMPTEGTTYFFQFKTSKYMWNGNSRHLRCIAPDYSLAYYNAPYYEFEISKDDFNQQHRRLRLWSQQYPNTYYVAPEFPDIGEFNAAFLGDTLEDVSRRVPLGDCYDIDDAEQHWITYQPGGPFVQWSRPRVGEGSNESLRDSFFRSKSHWKPFDAEYIHAMASLLSDAVVPQPELGPALELAERGRVQHALARLASPLAAQLGLVSFVVGRRPQ